MPPVHPYFGHGHHPVREARQSFDALPSAVRGPVLMLMGCVMFSIMGALVKLLGQRLDSSQIAFFRSLFGFFATLPFVFTHGGRSAFRTTHPLGHLMRGALGLAAMMGGFYATTKLPLTASTAISFTAPLFMILTAIFLLGEVVRWRRGVATFVGFLGVIVMVRPGATALDPAALIGLGGAFLVALSTTMVKKLSKTERSLTILLYFGISSSLLAAVPAYFVWVPLSRIDLGMLAVVGTLGAMGQFCTVSAYSCGELTEIAPIDYSRLIFAGVMGFLIFSELPDIYTLLGALIIVGSTLYIARREAHLSRLHRAALAERPLHPHPHDPHEDDAQADGTGEPRLQSARG